MKTNRLLSLLMIAIVPSMLSAHAPKKVLIEYSKDSGILKISVPHSVKDVSAHYIETIRISVDDEEVNVIDYTTQSSKASHEVDLEMPDLKSGSEIKVNAKCNKMGAKSATLKVK